VGHCSAECLGTALPPQGVKIFNNLLHAHISGRKAKLRHFRGRQELPWISTDEHYNFDYQQNRPLREEILLLPGDHLSHECNYDTNWRNGEVVVGGLSTTDEMCESIIWYYPRMPLQMCISEYPKDQILAKFGIEEITAVEGPYQPTILAPESMANMTYSHALNTVFQWTPQFEEELQRDLRYSTHELMCVGEDIFVPGLFATYPVVDKEYEPIREC